MRIVAIVNPVSGAGMDPLAASRRVTMIRDELKQRGLEADIHLTEAAGHARMLATAAASARADLVIAWGGDGTINEVGGGLRGSSTPLALIPAGSGNGLAGALGIPRDPRAAIAKAIDGRTQLVDVGLFAGKPFFNVAGVGFDAHIARLFNLRSRGRRGPIPYVVIGVREGCSYAGQEYRLALDGARPSRLKALLIAFANGSEYGMGMRIAPKAKLDDGLLDACIVYDRPVLARFRDARHLVFGSVERAPQMEMRAISRATLEANGPIEFHLDGETGVIDSGRVEIAVEPGALAVKV
jgi:YegS/Rv2252/BmrU family lipid kinase